MTVEGELAAQHFVAQSEGEMGLRGVDIVELDPFMRGLLFTDGTVSRALEAHTLSAVRVTAVEQTRVLAPEREGRYLLAEPDEECIRRRVVMSIASEHPSVWAESYVLPERLPVEFLAALDGSPQGIGGSLAQLRLESWRELLWFGLGEPPSWGEGAAPGQVTLTRFYRIITQGRPALLISEAFAVERRSGSYRLSGAGEHERGARARERLDGRILAGEPAGDGLGSPAS